MVEAVTGLSPIRNSEVPIDSYSVQCVHRSPSPPMSSIAWRRSLRSTATARIQRATSSRLRRADSTSTTPHSSISTAGGRHAHIDMQKQVIRPTRPVEKLADRIHQVQAKRRHSEDPGPAQPIEDGRLTPAAQSATARPPGRCRPPPVQSTHTPALNET